MKITKKAFIDTMTANNTAFIGVVNKVLTSDEIYCGIRHLLDPTIMLELRSCEAKSNHLIFSGGSRLYFNQQGKYEFHKYEYPECTVYICCHISYDDFDEKDVYRCMHYMVKH